MSVKKFELTEPGSYVVVNTVTGERFVVNVTKKYPFFRISGAFSLNRFKETSGIPTLNESEIEKLMEESDKLNFHEIGALLSPHYPPTPAQKWKSDPRYKGWRTEYHRWVKEQLSNSNIQIKLGQLGVAVSETAELLEVLQNDTEEK